MRTVVFINSHSRRGSRHLLAVREFFAAHTAFDVVDYIVVEDLNNFDSYVDRLKSHKRITHVIVGGGDGTFMTVLNALKNRKNLIYGFLPLGTSNGFARNLGVPLDLTKALQVIEGNATRHINVGSVNGKLFSCATNIGITVQVVKEINNRVKRHLGPLAYYIVGVRILRRSKPITCELVIDGHHMSISTYDIAVIHGRYFGPVSVTKEGSVYNDKFTIFYSTDPRRSGFLGDVNSFAIGRQHKRRHISMLAATHLTIKTQHPQDIQADGEIVGKTPAEIKMIKDAIRVFVPPQQHN